MSHYLVTVKYVGTSASDRFVLEAGDRAAAVFEVVSQPGISVPGARELESIDVDEVAMYSEWRRLLVEAGEGK